MNRIINTLKNGSPKAKRVVMLAMLACIASLGFIITAIVLHQLVFFFGAVIGVFVIISLIQTLEVYEYKNELYNDDKVSNDNNMTMASVGSDVTEMPDDDSVNDYPLTAKDMKELLEQYESEAADIADKPDEEDVVDEEFEMTEDNAKSKSGHKDSGRKSRNKREKLKKNKKEKLKKNKNDKKEKIDKSKMIDEELEKDVKAFDNAEERSEEKKLVVIKQASDEEIATYNKKKIKKTLHKYKVKRDHRLVLVDFCEKYHIKQTPAYIWVSDKEFNLLLIEEEPRHLVLPLYSIKEITYLKKQEVNADTDYPAFHKKNLLTDLFRPYLPDYTQSTVATDLSSYKNLYGIGPGIYFTNRSAKSLFDLLSVGFTVDDKVTTSSKVNNYFKDAYKSGILLRDNVIDANGYADRISNTLDDMAQSTISYNEFKDTLNLMMKNKIITQEFAMHYMDVRDKMRKS